jgi:Protein of unknown function (Hypoth_ymh)
MPDRSPNLISDVVKNLAELKQLTMHEQGVLLLKRLSFHFPKGQAFSGHNLSLQSYGINDVGSLATGFPEAEVAETVLYLMHGPWRQIDREGFIAERLTRDGFFEITPEGWAEVERDSKVFVPDSTVIAALRFLHKDLRGYEHFFRDQKCNEAVAAAFRRLENRLNEIRDASASSSVKASSGVSLPHELYKEKDLKFPFPVLASGNAKSRAAYEQHLRSFLAAGIGWFRNAFDHEPHNLPVLGPVETLEHLFVASYMLHLIDISV